MTDDTRIVADIVVGGLLARWLGAALQLIALKAFIKPAAVWAGRSPYRWLDRMLGGALPDAPGSSIVPAGPGAAGADAQMHEPHGRPVAEAVGPASIAPPLELKH